ncbi:MAG: PPOX class F420-dependent oxidoreductase [Candidatus Rokubacteria bacterium 13_1_40CM_69_27]|nr:MAG: PPOX class F420-dependent oxidoreductase [Candidatus Rokubacteria bacterium 13_1_40CM_69_27]OLE37438.1 MAG: PPOX class F420-dependent oxidoreductase [Candidatus Rokubacteria bacterium 13_1_20CM_2_70_7]
MSDAPPGWALELLHQARVARLGTADRTARPLVVPVCYAFDGQHVYSAIDAKPKRTRALRRLRNIAENPAVALVVDHYDEEWTRLCYVIAEGRAEILTAGADYARGIDLLLAKYPQYRAMGLSREAGTLIRIAPERYLCWRYA